MTTKIIFSLRRFEELSALELQEILKLRQDIFIIEQNCIYPDIDGKDTESYHLCGHTIDGMLVCYSRLLPNGISYPGYASIGRVVCHRDFRKRGYARLLMEESVRQLRQFYPETPIKIGAQTYLKSFYNSLGFKELGQPYIEDGIPHLLMIL